MDVYEANGIALAKIDDDVRTWRAEYMRHVKLGIRWGFGGHVGLAARTTLKLDKTWQDSKPSELASL